MRLLFFVPLLMLFAPWGMEMVSRDNASHSNQYPSEAQDQIPDERAELAATTTQKKEKASARINVEAVTATLPKVAATASTSSAAAPVVSAPVPTPAPDLITLIEAAVLRHSNEARAAAGLSALTPDTRLRDIARAHSADMLANDFFSHENTAGCSSSCRATNAGYAWRSIGENIYMMSGFAQSPEKTAQMVVDGWMDSPGHRANILGSFTVSGVGVVSIDGNIYVTSLYAKPR